MFTLQSDLEPTDAGSRYPSRLLFSPDGNALLASAGEGVQVWPRWLDRPPRPAVESKSSLERVSLNPDGTRAYLYRSGNSYTDVLNVATGKITASGLPKEDPSWCHFDAAGGFALVCQAQGDLVRYDYEPARDRKKPFREVWTHARFADGESDKPLGSHYRFGTVCGPAGVFVGLEYKFGGSEPFRGLTVRSTADGSVVFYRALKSSDADRLLDAAGLTLAVHPSGRYMAYPDGTAVRFRPLTEDTKMRLKVALPVPPVEEVAPKKSAKKKSAKSAPGKALAKAKGKPKAKSKPKPPPEPVCRAVAFHPNGRVLAAADDAGLVTFFDTASWKVVQQFGWKLGALRALCFSADGTRAATLSAAGKIMVWDVEP